MANNEVDVLQVDELPSDPKEMALRLLGMTVAELKGIDEKVVSGRNYVGGLKTDVNKIIHDFNQNLRPPSLSIPTQPLAVQAQPMQHMPLAQPFPTANPVLDTLEIAKDDNQLEFDFYRKVKPEDIEYRLKMIESKIEVVESKLDSMLVLIKKNYQSLNGNHSQ
jgi:hypothetical protein